MQRVSKVEYSYIKPCALAEHSIESRLFREAKISQMRLQAYEAEHLGSTPRQHRTSQKLLQYSVEGQLI